MSRNSGIILVLAYPETVVMVAEEWYSPLLRYIGIGKKNYVRAGHAALVLINKKTGRLEYHDFGRYITSEPNGRVRGAIYDRELEFNLKAKIVDNSIQNLEEILHFLASNPSLTHGDGKLVASVCDQINYDEARRHIHKQQRFGHLRYAAFKSKATNCARFVTDTLIAATTNGIIRKKLIRSNWFTPSTVGNVVLANTKNTVFEVDATGIRPYALTVFKENWKCFMDRLPNYVPNLIGTIRPKEVRGVHENAQWLSGIAAGAWYEITRHPSLKDNELRLRRIAPNGRLDIDAVFKSVNGFDLEKEYKIIHNSNCAYCNILQHGKMYHLLYKRDFS